MFETDVVNEKAAGLSAILLRQHFLRLKRWHGYLIREDTYIGGSVGFSKVFWEVLIRVQMLPKPDSDFWRRSSMSLDDRISQEPRHC